MKRHNLWIIILCVFSYLQVGQLNAYTSLEVVTVSEQSFPRYEIFDAVIEAVHDATISSRIVAEVIELNFDINDVVPSGAVIMRFRADEFKARVAQVEAGLIADKAQKREAIAREKEAGSEYARISKLHKRKLLSQADLDRANADLKAAQARVQAVQAQYQTRQAQLVEAKVQLSYTTITAPYGGVVTERMIEIGEMVSPGQHLMSGVSLSSLRAVAHVPQYLLTTVQVAQRAELVLQDGRQLVGERTIIVPNADQKTHSFRVRVDLPVDSEQLYPGMYAKLYFLTGKESVTVIAESAIVQRSEVAGVYVLTAGNKVLFRQIRLGRKFPEGQREILAGLSVGEQVAREPASAVKALKLQSSHSQL